MKNKIVFLLLVIFIGNFLFPFLASAGEYQGYGGTVKYEGLVPCGKSSVGADETEGVKNPCQLCHLFVMLDGIIDFVLLDVLPWIVILMILIAGGMFYFAGGNPSLLLQAKKLITSVVIGLIIILCAYLIIGTILTVLGVQSWTTLDKWAGSGVFMVDCPINGNGGNTTNVNGDNTTNVNGEEWDKEKEVPGQSPLCEVEGHLDCDDGQKAENGKCEPGENTKENPVSKKTDDGKGWYCKFTAEFKPVVGGYLECYVPIGTIYVNCIDDPDYVAPEEGEWISASTDTSTDNVKVLSLNCPGGTKLEEGKCEAGSDTGVTPVGGEAYGDNGWSCRFSGDRGSPAEGEISIYCFPE